MFIVYDAASASRTVSGSHAHFNAGLLATIRACHPDDPVLFCAAPHELNDTRRMLGERDLSIQHLEDRGRAVLPTTPVGEAARVFRTTWRLVSRADPTDASYLVVAASSPAGVVGALLAARLRRGRGVRTQIIFHGLHSLFDERSKKPWRRLLDLRSAFQSTTRSQHSTAIVLEETIRSELLSRGWKSASDVAVLPHPVLPARAWRERELGLPVRIGFLGHGTIGKGFGDFLNLARSLTADYANRVEFHHIGSLPDEVEPSRVEILASSGGGERLDQEEYERRLSRMHYFCLPLQDYYRLNPSGTLMDALRWRRPLITLRGPLTTSLFRRHGEVGYLTEDIHDMEATIGQILDDTDPDRFRRQQHAIDRAASSRSPERLGPIYSRILQDSSGESGALEV